MSFTARRGEQDEGTVAGHPPRQSDCRCYSCLYRGKRTKLDRFHVGQCRYLRRHRFPRDRFGGYRGSEKMKLLLDTHIWLWSLAEPKRLSRRVQQELTDHDNDLWLSPVSTWEILLLHAKGRIYLHGNARDWITRATADLREAPLTHDIVVAAQELRLPHQDPADR